MHAIVYTTYGPPDGLRLKEVERPVPRENEVLIRVHAVGLNASDWEFLTGRPLYTHLWGLTKPRHQILGSDVAGVVDAVGPGVTAFQPGDAVFGDLFERWGGLAEYVCAPVEALLRKPPTLSFEQAAAIPQSALIALQGLRDEGPVQTGDQVLVNGAGGGAGTFAVQLGKHFGAHVTGVDHTEKLDLMRSLGADAVIDYTQEDFTQSGQLYDLILDFVAAHSLFAYQRALTRNGRYVMVGGTIPYVLQTLILGSLVSLIGTRTMRILTATPNQHLAFVTELIASGKITPVIDQVFALQEAPEALQYLGDGRAKGKVVIRVHSDL